MQASGFNGFRPFVFLMIGARRELMRKKKCLLVGNFDGAGNGVGVCGTSRRARRSGRADGCGSGRSRERWARAANVQRLTR